MLINNCPLNRLLEPLIKAVDQTSEVLIASAYVGAGACALLKMIERSKDIKVRLALGRALHDGLPHVTKQYLLKLDGVARAKGGGVRLDPIGFHSKLYVTDDLTLIGSSNLTENGLMNWTEANLSVQLSDAKLVEAEALRLWNAGVDLAAEIDNIPDVAVKRKSSRRDSVVSVQAEPTAETYGVSISLLDASGQVPLKSGLNWGLGGGRVRNRYEAYIRLPVNVISEASHVFGSVNPNTIFTALTHDGRRLKLLIQGSQTDKTTGNTIGKQISTQGANATLGEWMVQDCLGITGSTNVTLKDLTSYGRTTVEFYRLGIDDKGETLVFVDFSRR